MRTFLHGNLKPLQKIHLKIPSSAYFCLHYLNDVSKGVQRSDLEHLPYIITPGRMQSKTISPIDEHGSKIDRNSVFDCHLSPVRRQMAIKNFVSNDF